MTRDQKLNARIAATLARARHNEAVNALQRAKERKCTQDIERAQRRADMACLAAIRADVEAGE